MENPPKAVSTPGKPVMIYDGECGFCRRWVRRWEQRAADQVIFLPFQSVAVSEQFPKITRAQLAAAVHLVEPDGQVSRGAKAVLRFWSCSGRRRWPSRLYDKIPLAAWMAESAYRLVANHR